MYSPVSVENFGGLNLVDDPGTVGWSGAIDLLNVDFDQRGRVRTRDGYSTFASPAASSGDPVWGIYPYYSVAAGNSLLIGSDLGKLWAVDSAGATITSIAGSTSNCFTFARIGTSEYVYIGTTSTSGVRRWDGTAFSTPAGVGNGSLVAATADFRLAVADIGGTSHRVKFSDAGAPETFGANNYVDLNPGDNELIRAMCRWRDLLFVFKETRFFVFYGNSTDGDGNPVFNYRTVDAGAGVYPKGAAIPTEKGVYFLAWDGLYLTTGGPPRKVSQPVEPLFTGVNVPSFWPGDSICRPGVRGFTDNLPRMTYLAGRLYISLRLSDTVGPLVNNAILVYDTDTDTWTYWDVSANALGTFRGSDGVERVMIGDPDNEIVRTITSAASTDNGTAITSRYRSGFSTLGSPDPKAIREWKLTGIGSPTFKTATDFGSLSTGNTVTLGTSPAIAEGRDRTAVRGRQIGWQVSGTSAWTLNSLTAHTREKRSPGTDD